LTSSEWKCLEYPPFAESIQRLYTSNGPVLGTQTVLLSQQEIFSFVSNSSRTHHARITSHVWGDQRWRPVLIKLSLTISQASSTIPSLVTTSGRVSAFDTRSSSWQSEEEEEEEEEEGG
jgi:hypothetical protein